MTILTGVLESFPHFNFGNKVEQIFEFNPLFSCLPQKYLRPHYLSILGGSCIIPGASKVLDLLF